VALRVGWLAAIGGFALALGRLNRLLAVEPGTRNWFPVLAAAAIVSCVVTAAALAAGARPWLIIPLNLVGAALALARVGAGSTMAFGIIPTGATRGAVGDEIEVALELIRFGSAPVIAATGLVAVLAGLFWLLGAVTAFGAVKRHPLLMTVPTLGFYLILATLDRRPPEWWWPVLMAACGTAGLLAASERGVPGRVRSLLSGRVVPTRGKLLPLLTLGVVALAAGGAARAFAATVPEAGLVSWRSATGFGGLFGGISYNLFADMQQDLAGQSSEVVFVAKVSESPLPNSELYWKLITLDAYDGEFWLPANLEIVRPQREADWEAPDLAFTGPTVRVESVVRIASLRQNYLPVLYSPRSLTTDDELLAGSYRTREDSSVKFDARTWDGLEYRVISDLPIPDLSVLASSGGALSPIFENAQADGVFPVAPSQVQEPLASSQIRKVYTELPDEFPEGVQVLARQVTAQTSTTFERAMVLENFFRTTGGFVYDASASTGHSTLDLVSWLTDVESRNFRTGYCEQFASAMGLMARAVGIPSRLVFGFAPGELTTQSDGSELIVVRALHAHAWVELFMPGQGWVRFDPTPRGDGINPATVSRLGFDPNLYLPAPNTPETGTTAPIPGGRLNEEFLEPGSDPTQGLLSGPRAALGSWALPLLVLIVALILVPALKGIRRAARLKRLGSGDVMAGWSELTDRLTDLGHRIGWSQTPIEVAGRVDRAILPLANRLSAHVYGGRTVTDGRQAYKQAEAALRLRYRGWRWWLSWIQPRSLWSRQFRTVSESRTDALR
jgi:transglutaminase-like putative cysteine protease